MDMQQQDPARLDPARLDGDLVWSEYQLGIEPQTSFKVT
jgi:hypothetical protein